MNPAASKTQQLSLLNKICPGQILFIKGDFDDMRHLPVQAFIYFDPGTLMTHPSAFHFQILTGRVHVRRRGRSRERRRRQDGLGQHDAESHGRSSAADVAAEVKAEAVGGVVAASVPGAVEPTGSFG